MEDSPSIKRQKFILIEGAKSFDSEMDLDVCSEYTDGFNCSSNAFRGSEKVKLLKDFTTSSCSKVFQVSPKVKHLRVKVKPPKKDSPKVKVKPPKKDSPKVKVNLPKAFPQRYLWPVKPEADMPSTPRRPFDASLIRDLARTLPDYDDDIEKTVLEFEKSYPFKNGYSVDVLSLLAGGNAEMNYLYRNNGELVQVDENTLRGKYILICCFHIPIMREGFDSSCLQALATTCFELYSTRNDVEIVVVAKMNKLANYEALFNHFLLGFPSSCLVVPFKDSKRRDYICYYLHIRDRLFMQSLLLDKGKDKDIVNNRNILFSGYPRFANDYGVDAFPFTNEKLEELNAKDYPKWKTALTSQLEGLLGCAPSDVLKIMNPAGAREEITISELKEKVVGLYLCIRGNLITTLQDIRQQCRSKQLPFEVVLVYLPFVGCLDPQVCMRNIDNKLKQHNLSCWRLPFKNSVSRRLNRLMGIPARDKLVIVGAHNAFVEPYGGKVYRDLGIDAYPFSREGFVQRELDKVKEHTLESLLVYGSRNYVLQGDKKIAVSELIGRNVLLYYDSLSDPELFDQVLYWYYEIKENDPTFEMVFVRENSTAVLEDDSDLLASMPWLVCPYDPVHSAFLEKKFFTEGIEFHESLVEFGKNGRICSFRVKKHLTHHGPEGFPFGDSHLRRDVIEYLCLYFKFMCTPEYEVSLYNMSHLAL